MKKNLLTTLLIVMLFYVQNSFSQSTEMTAPPIEKNRIVKVDFFSPATGNLTFAYEQALMNSVTLEGSLGVIGVSFIDDSYHPKGLFLKAGPKFYFTPDYTFDGMRRFNDFQGAYFQPEIIYSGFGFDYDYYYSYQTTKQRGVNNSVALMLNFGKQWVLARILTLDLYTGIGYGKSWQYLKDNTSGGTAVLDEDYMTYKYSHMEVPETPIALSAGFKIGILLK